MQHIGAVPHLAAEPLAEQQRHIGLVIDIKILTLIPSPNVLLLSGVAGGW